jgi:DNA-binding transcriptional ArsR family regulator
LAEISEEQNEDNLVNKIQMFSNTDEKLKSLGKMLNNDSSRKILQMLIEKEMTANEIATQTQSSLPLALYHINQMIKAGVVVVSKTSTNGKNQPMKYYSAKPGIIILPEKAFQKAKQSKSFANSLKRIMKFASVGIAAVITWFGSQAIQNNIPITTPSDIPDVIINSTLERTITPNEIPVDVVWSVVVTGLVITSLCLIFIFNKKRKKRSVKT